MGAEHRPTGEVMPAWVAELTARHCGPCPARLPGDPARCGDDGGRRPCSAVAVADACPRGTRFERVDPAVPAFDPDEQALLAAAENPEGLGDHAAALIHKLGVDRAYQMLRKAAGLSGGCGGCNARRQSLNRLGDWVRRAFGPRDGE